MAVGGCSSSATDQFINPNLAGSTIICRGCTPIWPIPLENAQAAWRQVAGMVLNVALLAVLICWGSLWRWAVAVGCSRFAGGLDRRTAAAWNRPARRQARLAERRRRGRESCRPAAAAGLPAAGAVPLPPRPAAPTISPTSTTAT